MDFTLRAKKDIRVNLSKIPLTYPKEYLLFASLPTALAGGIGVWTLATCAFMADISPPETLAFRFGMNHLASSLGRTLAPTAGAYILEAGIFFIFNKLD